MCALSDVRRMVEVRLRMASQTGDKYFRAAECTEALRHRDRRVVYLDESRGKLPKRTTATQRRHSGTASGWYSGTDIVLNLHGRNSDRNGDNVMKCIDEVCHPHKELNCRWAILNTGDMGILAWILPKLVGATKPATKLYTREERERATACPAATVWSAARMVEVKAAARPTVTDRVRRR